MQRNEVIQKIKYLEKLLNIDKSTHEEMLMMGYGVSSCKDLNDSQLFAFFKLLEKDGVDAGVWKAHKKSFNIHKYNELEGRDGMASPKQLRFIEGLWSDVSTQTDDDKRAQALTKMLQRIAGVADMRFVSSAGASKMIKALQSMKENQKKTS